MARGIVQQGGFGNNLEALLAEGIEESDLFDIFEITGTAN